MLEWIEAFIGRMFESSQSSRIDEAAATEASQQMDLIV